MKKHLACLAVAVPFLAVIILAACSDGTGGGINGPVQADVVIVPGAQILGFQAYDPDTITVQLNGAASVKVIWRNDDQVGGVNVQHNVSDTTVANAFGITIDPGDTASVTFSTAGSYPYKCSFHPGMRGLVVVQP